MIICAHFSADKLCNLRKLDCKAKTGGTFAEYARGLIWPPLPGMVRSETGIKT
jgi:hypothetical protein